MTPTLIGEWPARTPAQDWSDRLVRQPVAGNNVSYSYDAFDVRVGTTLNGTTSNYLWDRQATYPQLVDDGTYAYLHNAGRWPKLMAAAALSVN
ncbi:MAG: hypothetical protein R2867_17350 [Caldilineaceae bacterium]